MPLRRGTFDGAKVPKTPLSHFAESTLGFYLPSLAPRQSTTNSQPGRPVRAFTALRHATGVTVTAHPARFGPRGTERTRDFQSLRYLSDPSSVRSAGYRSQRDRQVVGCPFFGLRFFGQAKKGNVGALHPAQSNLNRRGAAQITSSRRQAEIQVPRRRGATSPGFKQTTRSAQKPTP